MKKKNAPKAKQDMPEFAFKQFTSEEDRIYVEAVNAFREAIAAGKTLKQAYEAYTIDDGELASIIHADFLKIMIAERHFAQNQSLEDVANALDVSQDLIKNTYARMLQEVGINAADQFGREFGDIIPKTSD